jgi:uncharacterized membrane protein
MAWIFSVAFLPFPSQLLGSGRNERPEVVLYIATLTLSSASLSAIRWHLRRHDEVAGRETPASPATPEVGDPIGATFALFVVALLIAAAVPGVGAWALLVLLLQWPLGWAIRRARWNVDGYGAASSTQGVDTGGGPRADAPDEELR